MNLEQVRRRVHNGIGVNGGFESRHSCGSDPGDGMNPVREISQWESIAGLRNFKPFWPRRVKRKGEGREFLFDFALYSL